MTDFKAAAGGQQVTGVAGGRPAPQPGAPNQVTISVKKAMEQAFRLYGAGRLEQAGKLCAQIVQARPKIPDAHNLLAAILHAQGNDAGAVKALQHAIRLNDSNPQFYANLGEIERKRGKLREATLALERAISLDPRSARALNNLGIVCYDRRDFATAAENYRKAIAINPSYAEAHNNLGNALRALGKSDEALEHYQKALVVRENYAEAYNNMAAVLREKDQVAEAEHAYRKAIALKPNYLEAYSNLAIMYIQRDRADEALKVLGEALEINPKHVPTLVQVARTQCKKGNYAQAEQAARLALKEDPENAMANAALGEVLHETDRFEEALSCYETALRLKPESGEVRNHYGVLLKSVGRLEEARAEFLKALEFNPRAYGCYTNLADLEKFTPESPLFQAMKKVMDEADDPMSERYMGLHFALGKAYEDIGEYATALNHFQRGATLKRATLDYKEEEAFRFFDMIRETFPAEFFAERRFDGNPTDLPIFIVGMPRSGSTLVEQILSSHPDVFGAGEIKEFPRRMGILRSRFPALPLYPQMATKMSQAQFQILAEGYIARLRAVAPSAARVTDKLLTNYYFVGLIHLLYPNARIIHTKRNPVDTCISAYTKLFKDDMPHSYDFGELGRYYLKYEELMRHWETVLPPGTLKTVVYEEVVADLESWARDIIDFVGLPWNDACLAFHESSRPVKTASVVQVRKPVYTTSVERWRRYGPEIQPLIDSLRYEAKAA